MTAPDEGRSSPAIRFSSEDLPDPEGPRRATNSPARISIEMPSTARTNASPIWKWRQTFSVRTAGAFGPAPSMLANLPHRESQRDSNTIVLVLSGLGALRARARCNRIVLCREGQKNAGSRNLPIPEPASAWQVIFASVAALPHWVLNAKDEDT